MQLAHLGQLGAAQALGDRARPGRRRPARPRGRGARPSRRRPRSRTPGRCWPWRRRPCSRRRPRRPSRWRRPRRPRSRVRAGGCAGRRTRASPTGRRSRRPSAVPASRSGPTSATVPVDDPHVGRAVVARAGSSTRPAFSSSSVMRPPPRSRAGSAGSSASRLDSSRYRQAIRTAMPLATWSVISARGRVGDLGGDLDAPVHRARVHDHAVLGQGGQAVGADAVQRGCTRGWWGRTRGSCVRAGPAAGTARRCRAGRRRRPRRPRRCPARAPQSSRYGGSRVGGAHTRTVAPASVSACTSERATRECSTSPTMVTARPSRCPKARRIVKASSSAWVGCWCQPSPALSTGTSSWRRQLQRGARGGRADHHHVQAHGAQGQGGVLERLALGDRRALAREVDDVGRQALGGDVEARCGCGWSPRGTGCRRSGRAGPGPS